MLQMNYAVLNGRSQYTSTSSRSVDGMHLKHLPKWIIQKCCSTEQPLGCFLGKEIVLMPGYCLSFHVSFTHKDRTYAQYV